MAKRRKKSQIKKTKGGAVFYTDITGEKVYDLTNSTNILRDMNRAIKEDINKTGSMPGATEWFMEKIESGAMELPDDSELTHKILKDRQRMTTKSIMDLPGRMFAFLYYPKTRVSLEYYDLTPLIITLPSVGKRNSQEMSNNILGINLHYIEPDYRTLLLEKLLRFSHPYYGEKRPPKLSGYFFIEYELLKTMKYIAGLPCVRSYDTARIVGKPILIPSNEWGNATSLPFHNFIKKKEQTIWLQTRLKIREFILNLGKM